MNYAGNGHFWKSGRSRIFRIPRNNSGNNYIKGVRQVLHTPEQPPKHCLSSEFMQGIRELGKRGLLFDICIRPAEIQDAVELCRQNPETIFMLDHCGNADPYVVNGQRRENFSPQDSTFVHTSENWQEELGNWEDWIMCIAKFPE